MSIGHATTTVDRATFVDLLGSSVKCEAASYQNALRDSRSRFSDLVDLARGADIPYVLFFASAPLGVNGAFFRRPQAAAVLKRGVLRRCTTIFSTLAGTASGQVTYFDGRGEGPGR